MTDSNIVAESQPQVVPLRAHSYPIWLQVVAGLVGLAVIYSVLVLPRYYSAASLTEKAQAAVEAQNYPDAAKLLEQAAARVPDSKVIRLQLAYVCFKIGSATAHDEALGALSGLTMDQDEWNVLQPVMPAADQAQFHQVSN